jgi:hypothetical protein
MSVLLIAWSHYFGDVGVSPLADLGHLSRGINCDAICPCRTIGGRWGGRSTEGICLGALSWLIDEGTAGDADLGGLRTVLALPYDDDEPGSPWDFFLYLDRQADRSPS